MRGIVDSEASSEKKYPDGTGDDKRTGLHLEPGRSRVRNSHLEARQTIPEGIGPLAERTLVWTSGQANESEAELWLKADIVPLVKETTTEDGTTEVKLRPIAISEESGETH